MQRLSFSYRKTRIYQIIYSIENAWTLGMKKVKSDSEIISSEINLRENWCARFNFAAKLSHFQVIIREESKTNWWILRLCLKAMARKSLVSKERFSNSNQVVVNSQVGLTNLPLQPPRGLSSVWVMRCLRSREWVAGALGVLERL